MFFHSDETDKKLTLPFKKRGKGVREHTLGLEG